MSLKYLFPLLLCTGCLVTDAGELISDTRQVPTFDAIEVRNGLNVKVKIGAHQDARIYGHERLVEDIVLYEYKGRLIVERESASLVFTEGRADIELSTPSLVSLSASGGSNVTTQGDIDATRFTLEASGGSTVGVPSLDAGKVEVDASGGSVVTVTGAADQVLIEASGGSVLSLGELEARLISVDASGGSVLTLNASDEVSGNASGGSVLNVRGHPAVLEVKLSGGSVVKEN